MFLLGQAIVMSNAPYPFFLNILMEKSIEYSYLHDTQTPYP